MNFVSTQVSLMMEIGTKNRVKKACQICRRRKIKCDGLLPCNNCITFKRDCKYDGSEGITKPRLNSNKQRMFRELDNMANSFNTLKSLSAMNTEMMSEDLAQMEAKFSNYKKQLEHVPDLQSFSLYEGDNCIEKMMFNSEDLKSGKFGGHEISSYYGLYNPTSLESTDSFGWILEKLDLTKKDSKTTIFLFLKYLDFASKYYYKLMTLQSSPSKWLSSKFGNPKNTSNEISFVIETLNKELSFELDFKVENFQLINNFITKMRQFNSNEPYKLGCLKKRIEQEESGLVVGYASFMSSVLSEMHNPNSISNILSFLEGMHWYMDLSSIGRFVAIAVRQSLDLGLSRWEFYLNLNEHQAEYRRELFWKCFWWDRWYSLLSGKPFLIDENCVVCLFPRRIINLGACNTMSLPELLELFQPDKGHVYFYIILSKIITKILGSVGYNKKYTGFHHNPDHLLQDLLKEYNEMTQYFDILRKKFDPFTKDLRQYENLSLFFSYNYTRIGCTAVIESILWRLKKQLDITILQRNLELCREMLLHILQIDAPNLMYLFVGPITNLLVVFVFNLSETKLVAYDLTILCRIARLFGEFIEKIENENDVAYQVNYFNVLSFRAFIIIRLCFEYYISISNSSESELITEISELDIKSSEMCQKLFDRKSTLFEPLIRNVEMSNFHLHLLGIFRNEIGPNFSEEVHKTIEKESVNSFDQFNPFQGVREIPMTGFDELDAFLNSDLSLDNLKNIW